MNEPMAPKKWIIPLALLILTVAAGAYFLMRPAPRGEQVTVNQLNDAEAAFYEMATPNYELVIDWAFYGELRRHVARVENHVLLTAQVQYWDDEQNTWSALVDVPENQADYLTVPGMFRMLRTELINELRSEIRVEIDGDPLLPRYIFLGAMEDEGVLIRETEVEITVVSFSPLTTPY